MKLYIIISTEQQQLKEMKDKPAQAVHAVNKFNKKKPCWRQRDTKPTVTTRTCVDVVDNDTMRLPARKWVNSARGAVQGITLTKWAEQRKVSQSLTQATDAHS